MAKAKQVAKVAKTPKLRKIPQKITNVVVLSDTHVGCQMGLMDPSGAMIDGGGLIMPNKLQVKLYNIWQDFWEWVTEATRGEPYAVVMNGDALDGVHHGAVSQWSQNMNDQRQHAFQLLKPIVERCEGRYYHLRGTEAHSGKSGQDEEQLARELGAIPNEDGLYARYELWLRIGAGLAHVTHHIGSSGSLAYESSAVMRELSDAYVEAGRWNNEPPTWLARSHRHRNIEVRIQTCKGFATAFTTAAWQLKTAYSYKITGGRQTQPQIGGSLMRAGNEDMFTRHYVCSLARSPEVVL